MGCLTKRGRGGGGGASRKDLEFVSIKFWIEFVIGNWETLKSLIPKFADFDLSRILYMCSVLTLEENNKISVRNTSESPPPEEKLHHGMIRVIPL